MAKFKPVDMRNVFLALGRAPAEVRCAVGKQLREAFTQLGVLTMGMPDEMVGQNADRLTRALSATIGELRRMEDPDWFPPDVQEQFGSDIQAANREAIAAINADHAARTAAATQGASSAESQQKKHQGRGA